LINIGHDREGKTEPFDVRGQPRWIGKRHDRNLCSSEFIESLAHGNDMFLTRQSSQVTMQNQHEGYVPNAMIVGVPRP
jgi:hypothetical protein